MRRDKVIDRALEIAGSSLLLVATTDGKGLPHLAAAKTIDRPQPGRIAVTDWFCPETVANAVIGRPVSVVIWDAAQDEGHQLIGYVAALEAQSTMNGFLPGENVHAAPPQQRHRLLIDVSKVMAFHQAPHDDVEEE